MLPLSHRQHSLVNYSNGCVGTTETWSNRLKISKLLLALTLSALVAACSDDEQLEKKILFESYTMEQLEAFVEAGESEKVIEAITFYREEATATDEHYLLLATIYLGSGDGIAAEETLYKLRNRDFPEEKTALPLAQSLVMQGKHQDAEKALKGVALTGDDLFKSFILRGDIMLALGNIARAESFYQAAIDTDPDNFLAYAAMALFQVQQGDFRQAQVFIDQAETLEADGFLLHYSKGMVARYSGQLDDAKNHFVKAVEANSADTLSRLELVGLYLAADELELAQLQLDAIYAITPINPMANYYTALILVSESRFDEAEGLLLRTGDFTREYPLAAQVYGLTTYELEKYSTAIPYLSRALAFFPNDVSTRLALADSLARRGEAKRSLQVLQPLIAAEDNITALVHATAAAAGVGDVRSARRFIERALELAEQGGLNDPALMNALVRKAAFARFLDDDLDGATALLDAMYAEDEEDVESLTNKANMFLASGDLGQAQTALNQLLSFDPENTVAANLKGAILHRQRRFDEAIEAYTEAIAKVPEYQSAIKNRAFAYIQKEDYEKARADLQILIDLSVEEPQVQAMYGRSLIETGDPEGALPFLARAVDGLPNSSIVRADRAEALAMLGYYSRALDSAAEARDLGAFDQDFVTYIDEKIEEWDLALSDQNKLAEEERTRRAEEFEKQRAAELEKQEAIKEQSRDILDAEEDQSELMAELERIAEDNRRLREEERQKALEVDATPEPQISAEQAAREARELKIRTTRNQLFGLWLAGELGLDKEAAVAYAESVIKADESEPGDTDIIRKAITDLEAAGKTMTIQAIEQAIAEKAVEAQTAHADDQPESQ